MLERSRGIHSPHSCWFREVAESPHRYGYVNTFAHLQDPMLRVIISHYDFILRTDPDTFLAPSFFDCNSAIRSKAIVGRKDVLLVGEGAYSHEVNFLKMNRIAAELGLKRLQMRNLGSTWLVSSTLFIPISRLALFLTLFVFHEGFKHPSNSSSGAAGGRDKILSASGRSLEGLAEEEEEGENRSRWPEWFRGVSSMYGSDMAIQHFAATLDLKETDMREYGLLDFSSYSREPLRKVGHVHARGNLNRMFGKYPFTRAVSSFCGNGTLSSQYEAELVQFGVSHLSSEPWSPVNEYCHSTAIRATLDHFVERGCGSSSSSSKGFSQFSQSAQDPDGKRRMKKIGRMADQIE